MSREDKTCFIHDGVKYEFASRRQAATAAFRLTGKIGSVTFYQCHNPPPPPVMEASERRKESDMKLLVRLIITCLVLAITGLVIDAPLMVDLLLVVWPFLAIIALSAFALWWVNRNIMMKRGGAS
jgi:hypothetical protein